ncbi:MAG: type VI secretion system baseplate subunit TssF [Janthinobacterium lividum]
MLNSYYEQELANLRTLSVEFARRNPTLAPLLSANAVPDPDVERLLEGVAFLTGLLRQRLDDEFPEFIQEIARLLYPQYLQPLPCMTIMQYEPKDMPGAAISIPAGSEAASTPVDNTPALFRSVFPVSVEPLALRRVSWEARGAQTRSMRFDFEFVAIEAARWRAASLRFFLGDAFADACRLLRLLMRHTQSIRIEAEGARPTWLPPGVIKMTGLRTDLPLLPGSPNAHPAFVLLHEYFAYAEKLLFIDIGGFDGWTTRGQSGHFSLHIHFDTVPDWAPELGDSSFLMNATPALNLFEADAHPIRYDHRQTEYKLQMSARDGGQAARIFDVRDVIRHTAIGDISHRPFEEFASSEHLYQVRVKASAVSDDHEHYLGIPYIGHAARNAAEVQTLSVRVQCTHGTLPEALKLGDISHSTQHSPIRMQFRNIRGVSAYHPPALDQGLLWRVLSQLSANHQRLRDAAQLRALLALHVPEVRQGRIRTRDQRRIESIEACEVRPARRFVRGLPIDGSEILLVCRGANFAGQGGLFLFGCVMDEFLAALTAINTFSALTIRDATSGEVLQWPPKIGQQRSL